jgi:hypothetical protein
MTYILNLTLVMQNLFWIQNILAENLRSEDHTIPSTHPARVTVPITRRLIKLAFKLHREADDRDNLLNKIDKYSKKVNLFLPQGRADATVAKIIELINSSTISDEVAFKQRGSIKKLDESWKGGEDEAWDPPSPEHADA